jgi:uncharacterized membrane protein
MNPSISRRRRFMSAQARNQGGSDAGCCSGVNVGETERQASMWGGTVLAVCGLLKGSFSGLALAALGGALIYRGHTGHCHVYEALGHNTAEAGSRHDVRHAYAKA